MTLAEVTSTAVHTCGQPALTRPSLMPRSYSHRWLVMIEPGFLHTQNTHFHTLSRKIFGGLLAQRAARVPIAYLTGHKEFFGLDFVVNKKSSLPRPETELLVQTALDYIATYPSTRSLLDIGTGSGAIACAIARHAPGLSHPRG